MLQRFGNLLAETLRLARVVSVGVAWSIPLVLSAHHDANPALSPAAASLVDSIGDSALYAAPALAVIGICIVASLSSFAEHWGRISAIPILVLLVPSLALASSWQPPEWLILPLFSVAAVAALLSVPAGLAVTLAVLWRRTRWLAPVWLLIWLASANLMLYSGQVPDGYPHMGAATGGMIFVLMMTVLLVSILAGSAAYVASGLVSRVRGVSAGGPI